MTITESTIRQLLDAGESSTVEFKIKAPRPSELAERICGMANTREGGTILFGIEDSTGRAVGLAQPNETIDVILRAARLVKPQVSLIGAAPTTVMIDNVPVIAIQIAPNPGPLYQASGVFWVRKGSHTIPMTMEEVENHLNSYGSTRWETKLCPRATLDDIDFDRVQRHLAYRDERSQAKLRATSKEDLLLGLECAARDPQTSELRPTNAGMLMFARAPQLQIPQSELVCIRYADRLGVGKYVDRKNF